MPDAWDLLRGSCCAGPADGRGGPCLEWATHFTEERVCVPTYQDGPTPVLAPITYHFSCYCEAHAPADARPIQGSQAAEGLVTRTGGGCEVMDMEATTGCPDCNGRGFVRGKWYRAENRCKRCDGYGRVSRRNVEAGR